MDQTTPTRKTYLWSITECCEEPNMDWHLDVCARRHRQERLQLDASLYTLLQILSVTIFAKLPINKALLCTRSQLTPSASTTN